ncbi:MAG: glycosyltransferase family 2 protein [Eubacteriales bacterium]|nr:glycosyltransferase family 2 protein [Eubacteriales bacterium]
MEKGTDKPKTISVCMIVKNEEKVLDRALKGVSRFADEIVVVDTGSSDRTMEIAAKYTDRIYEHPWEGHFGRMRNISYSYAVCDYVMYFDADYEIDAENADRINRLKETLTVEKSVCVTYYSPEQKLPVMLHCISLRDGRRWEGAVHERLPLKDPVLYTDIVIRHVKKEELHYERNVQLFPKLTPEELRAHYWLAAQCYSDSVMADASGWADFFFELAQRGEYDFTDKPSPAVTAGHVLMYYGRYREALKWLEAYLAESGRWLEIHVRSRGAAEGACGRDADAFVGAALSCDEKACNYAVRCALGCGEWVRAETLNQRLKAYHQNSPLFLLNRLRIERARKKEAGRQEEADGNQRVHDCQE